MKRVFLSDTKGLLLTIVTIILIGSLFGFYKAFTLPSEVVEETTLVNYEHRGEFDYVAHINASYLFGDIPLETDDTTPKYPPANPKYPIEMIGSFDMSFNYRFVIDTPVTTSQDVEVTAVIYKPDADKEEVTLVPERTETGDFTVDFSLVGNELDFNSPITINATVYTTVKTDKEPILESFTQSLAMRPVGPFLEIDRILTESQQASFGNLDYEQIGEFDYSIRLKPTSPFGAITLKPPSATPTTTATLPSATTLGPGEPLYSSLLDSLDVDYSYTFRSDVRVNQITESVEINAIIENPDVWSKTFVLVPLTEKNGDFTVTFPLDTEDLEYFRDVFSTIERETSVSGPHNLIIKADVHAVAQTDFGSIDEVFSQTLTTTLGQDILEWEEDLTVSEPGLITMNIMIPNPAQYIGLSVGGIRNLSAVVAGLFFFLFLYLLIVNIWFKTGEIPLVEQEALYVKKKYKKIIADVEQLPKATFDETVISLDSLDELVKIADSLLKPVLHKHESHKHTYCVIDGKTRYEYVLTWSSGKLGSKFEYSE
jgi:hypothetical protein